MASGALLGAVFGLESMGLAMDAVALSAGKELREKLNLPDFGELVMTKFIETPPKRFPAGPKW